MCYDNIILKIFYSDSFSFPERLALTFGTSAPFRKRMEAISMKPKTLLTILLTGSILFSAYTMTLPWIHVHPGLSTAVNWGNSVNDIVADGLSALTGLLGDIADGQGDYESSDQLEGFRDALKNEKELVDILSEGDCTPYDYSRVMTGLAGTFPDQQAKAYFGAQGYGYYAVILLGLIAFVAAILGRFGWSALFSAGLGIYLAAVYTMIGAVNEMFDAVVLDAADGFFMALASAVLVFFFFVCTAFLPAADRIPAGKAKQAGREGPGPDRKESSEREGQGQASGPDSGPEGDDPYEDLWGWSGTNSNQSAGRQPEEAEGAPSPKGRKTWYRRPDIGFVLAVILLTLGIAAVVMIVRNRKPDPVSMDLSEYLQVEVSGFDGYGTVQNIFDWETFQTDLYDRMEDQAGKTGRKVQEGEDTAADAEKVLADMEINISSYDHLSNGDTLQPEFSLGEGGRDILDRYFVILDTEKFLEPIPIDGLKEIVSYDPFEDLEIYFDGAEPYGEAYVSYLGDYSDVLYPEVSPSSGLKNGDPVTITVESWYDEEALKESYGIELTRTQETAWVSGLKYYPGSIGDISESGMEEIMEKARDIAVSNISDEYTSGEQMAGLTALGQILAASDTDNAQIHNHLFCLFQVSYANTSGDSRSYIYFVGFKNVMTDPDTGDLEYSAADCLVPQKPDFIADTLNMDLKLSEFVMVRLLPPRILSGFSSAGGFYNRYVSPLEDTCTVTVSGSDLEDLLQGGTGQPE